VVELCTSILCRPNCNSFVQGPFVEDPLEDSEILRNGEGGDIEQWLEPWNNFLVFGLLVSLSITFHYSYLCSSSSCIL